MHDSLISRTIEASRKWQAFFNQGDAAGCASMYEEDAQMVAKPFGTYEGRPHIEEFWQNLIGQGFADVEYIKPKIEVIDDQSVALSSNWTMNNAQGVITRELWVCQDDGSMLMREDRFEAIDANTE